uniref:Uncharacterized protein n=1 Tax=Anguilla anguilla TaxID=7936 RepID=A0A0E9UCL4_ANGAN
MASMSALLDRVWVKVDVCVYSEKSCFPGGELHREELLLSLHSMFDQRCL